LRDYPNADAHAEIETVHKLHSILEIFRIPSQSNSPFSQQGLRRSTNRRQDMTTRRQIIQGAAALGAASLAPALQAQVRPVRIGYAMARTGPWTGGAQVSQEPNYLLWAEQINAAGGLDVKGVKLSLIHI
jgi:hypothetical protein